MTTLILTLLILGPFYISGVLLLIVFVKEAVHAIKHTMGISETKVKRDKFGDIIE